MSTLLQQQPAQQQEINERQNKIHAYYNEKVVGNFTKKEIDVLKTTIAAGTNQEEFSLFMQTCVTSGLNPFLNQIYPVIYSPQDPNKRKMNIQISVEGIMSLARRKEGFAGVDVQLVGENDNFKMGRVDGSMKIITHEISFPRGQIVGGYAIAKRKGYEDVIIIMEAHEVDHLKRGQNGHMWNNYFSDMFKKHMLKRAAKDQYGIELSEDEGSQAQPTDHFKAPETKIVNEVKEVIPEPQKQPVMSEEDQLKALWNQIHEIAGQKEMSQNQIDRLIAQHFQGKAREDMLPAECAALKKFVELTPTEPEQEPELDEMDQFAMIFE